MPGTNRARRPSAAWIVGFAVFAATASAGESEEGFVSLFDGKTLDGWTVMNGEPDSFAVQDGTIYCPGKTGYPCWLRSDKEYENFDLRFDFLFKGWCNGGFFFHAPLHGRNSRTGFEFQIYHDKSNKPSANICGGIFGAVPPMVNAVNDREVWNSARILMDWPSLKVWLNGTLVHDLNLEEHEELRYRLRRGYFGIQDVNYRTWFRNLRVRELPSKEEWRPLFNGENFDGWREEGEGATWWVEDGAIRSRDNGSYLVTEDEFEDFELFTYVRSDRNANGGIFFRWNNLKDRDRGYEIQIENVPDSPHPTGSLYNIVRAIQPRYDVGEWFPMQIRVEGKHVVVRVNGETTVDYEGLDLVRPGHIALQMHFDGKWMDWKGIKIKPL